MHRTGIPAVGTEIPSNLMPFFLNKQAAGTWTLVVMDDNPGHTGTLDYWCLDITTAIPTPTPAPTPAGPQTLLSLAATMTDNFDDNALN